MITNKGIDTYCYELDEISVLAVHDEILLARNATNHLTLFILKAVEVSAVECSQLGTGDSFTSTNRVGVVTFSNLMTKNLNLLSKRSHFILLDLRDCGLSPLLLLLLATSELN